MKKFAKRLLAALAIFVIVFALTPAYLPSSTHVERSIEIKAPPAAVFDVVSDFNQSRNWDPWVEQDPGIKSNVTGSGVGSTYQWDGDASGAGISKIVVLDAPKLVKTELHMTRPMEDTFTSDWQLTPQDEGTLATWTFDQNLGYFQRYATICTEWIIGPAFEKGLANLKAYIEK